MLNLMKNNSNSKSQKKSLVWGTILFFAFTVLTTVIMFEVMFDLSEDFVSLENSGKGVQKDDYVSVEVTNVLAGYAETTNVVAFVTTSIDEHYVVLLDNGSVVPIVTSDKELKNKLDDIRNRCQAGEVITEPVIIKGLVHTFDPQIERYYKGTLEDAGITDETNRIYWAEVDGTETMLKAWSMVLLFAAMGIACLIFLIRTIKKEKNEVAFANMPTYENMDTPKYDSSSVNKPDDVFTRAEREGKQKTFWT